LGGGAGTGAADANVAGLLNCGTPKPSSALGAIHVATTHANLDALDPAAFAQLTTASSL
jgi:hypothetical protein